MVAGDDQRLVEVGLGDEIGQGVVVQVLRTADVAERETLRIAHVDHRCALFAQRLRLLRGNAFELAHVGLAGDY